MLRDTKHGLERIAGWRRGGATQSVIASWQMGHRGVAQHHAVPRCDSGRYLRAPPVS